MNFVAGGFLIDHNIGTKSQITQSIYTVQVLVNGAVVICQDIDGFSSDISDIGVCRKDFEVPCQILSGIVPRKMYVLDFQLVQPIDIILVYQTNIQALCKVNIGVLAESKLL